MAYESSRSDNYKSFRAALDNWLTRLSHINEQSNKLSPFSILSFNDPYFESHALEHLSQSPCQVETLDASTLSPERIAEFQQSPLFLTEKQIVIIKRCGTQDIRRMITAATAGPFTSPIVCICQKPLGKTNLKGSSLEIIKQPTLKSYELPGVIADLAKNRGLSLARDLIDFLVESGQTLVLIDNELRKLPLINPQLTNTTIDLSAAHRLISFIPSPNAFAIDRALLRMDYAEAIATTDLLLNSGESPIALLGVISRHCRNYLSTWSSSKNGPSSMSSSSPARNHTVKLPMNVVNRYNRIMTKVPVSTYRMVLNKCTTGDILLKSSSIPPSLVIGDIIDSFTTISP